MARKKQRKTEYWRWCFKCKQYHRNTSAISHAHEKFMGKAAYSTRPKRRQ